MLEYPNSDAIKIQAQKELLAAVGVQLESFGQNSFVIHSHPTWIAQGQEEATIREMIDTVLENGKLDIAHFREKTAIMISCKQSIKAHHHLDDAQAKALLVDLAQTENPFNCPHGRPVLIHYTQKDLEKKCLNGFKIHTIVGRANNVYLSITITKTPRTFTKSRA